MSVFGVVTGDAPPVLGGSVTHNNAEDNVRRVVKALLAVSEVPATTLGEYLGMKKAAIYKRLNGTQPFTVAEVAAVSEFFEVPVQVMFAGPAALLRTVPEAVAGGRGAAAGRHDVMSSQDYAEQENRRSGGSPDQLTYLSKSTPSALARVFSLAEARERRGVAA